MVRLYRNNTAAALMTVAIILLFTLTGCINSDEPTPADNVTPVIAGGDDFWLDSDDPEVMGFWVQEETGLTMELRDEMHGFLGGTEVMWKTEEGRIYMMGSRGIIAGNYTMTGRTLTIADDSGELILFRRTTPQELLALRESKADRQMVYLFITDLMRAVEAYERHVGEPPTTEQGLTALVDAPDDLANPASWRGPYIVSRALFRDPWGNEYQYISPGREGASFDIWSFGPDGIDDTPDDIGSWMPAGDFW